MHIRPWTVGLTAFLALAASGHGAADAAGARFVTSHARQCLGDALGEWSLRNIRTYAHAASLPAAWVVVAQAGQEADLTPVIEAQGWHMTETNGVILVARAGDAEKVPALRKALLESPDEAGRRSAAHALGRLTVPAAATALAAGLGDSSAGVRFQCLEALWALESDFDMRRLPRRVSLMKMAGLRAASLAACAEAAVTDRPRRAWRYAVTLLGRAESPLVRPLALAGLADPEPRIPVVAARALRHTAAAGDGQALAAFVRTTKDWAARREAVVALAFLPDSGRNNVMELAAGADEDLACEACEALGLTENQAIAVAPLVEAFRGGGPNRAVLASEALGRLNAPAAELALLEGLRAGEAWRRVAAANGLAAGPRIRPAAAAAALLVAAQGEPALRAAAAKALPACAPCDVQAALLELSRDDDRAVRQAALRSLKRAGGAAALARLHEMADDPVREIAEEARHGLGWLGGAKEAERLVAIVRDPALDRDGAPGAFDGLGCLLPPEARDIAVRALIDLMQDPPKCPFAAGRAAAGLADARLIPSLLAVQARNQQGRKGTPRSGMKLAVDCMDAFGRIATRAATEALARDWWEYENMTRYQVGRALRDNLEHGEVHETLLALTKSTGQTLTAAAFSLANSRDPRAVAALVELLEARKEAVAAATSLGMIADPAATDALLSAAQDPAHPGRFAAGRALRMRDLAWQPRVRETLTRLYGWRPDGTPPPVGEQQPNSWVLRRWARDFDDMTMSLLTYESAAAYDTRRGRVMQWGAHGRRYDSPQTGETWIYDAGANTWTEGGARERPPGCCMTREICYDGANDRLIVRGAGGGAHGWLWPREQALRRSSPWVYDPERDRWMPMRAIQPEGFSLGSRIAFDRRHGVALGLGREAGAIWAYDAYANRWTPAPLTAGKPSTGFHGIAYDRDLGRMLFLGSAACWSYDLQSGTWADTQARDTPKGAAPLIYDTANRVALAFAAGQGGTTVYAYDSAANGWSTLKTAGMQPDYGEWDAAFDERRNVAVVCGGEVTSSPGSPTCRETWTYRFAMPARERTPMLEAPGPATAVATPQGVLLRWTPAGDQRVTGYRIERMAGDLSWGSRSESLTERPVKEASFLDKAPLPDGQAALYLVRSANATGDLSPEPSMARTAPPVTVGVVATWNAERKARLTWDKNAAPDTAGYNVYRAPVTAGEFDGDSPVRELGRFEKVNLKPVKDASFVDPEPATAGHSGWVFAPRAYAVRAVNTRGVEGGLSAWAFTLPDCPKRIETRRRADGSVVVRWEKDPNPEVVGYVVYRMDNYRNERVTRINESPVSGTMLLDPDGRPTGERQRYWVVAVDRFGQEGPSGTGAWSFNR